MAALDQIRFGSTDYDLVPEIAPLFDATVNYAIGDYVIHDAKLYRFTTAHTAGVWIGTDAQEETVTDILTELKALAAIRLGTDTNGRFCIITEVE